MLRITILCAALVCGDAAPKSSTKDFKSMADSKSVCMESCSTAAKDVAVQGLLNAYILKLQQLDMVKDKDVLTAEAEAQGLDMPMSASPGVVRFSKYPNTQAKRLIGWNNAVLWSTCFDTIMEKVSDMYDDAKLRFRGMIPVRFQKKVRREVKRFGQLWEEPIENVLKRLGSKAAAPKLSGYNPDVKVTEVVDIVLKMGFEKFMASILIVLSENSLIKDLEMVNINGMQTISATDESDIFNVAHFLQKVIYTVAKSQEAVNLITVYILRNYLNSQQADVPLCIAKNAFAVILSPVLQSCIDTVESLQDAKRSGSIDKYQRKRLMNFMSLTTSMIEFGLSMPAREDLEQLS